MPDYRQKSMIRRLDEEKEKLPDQAKHKDEVDTSAKKRKKRKKMTKTRAVTPLTGVKG